jgi:uncharacterized membrane protein YbhN (UPF0104 family)
VLRDSTALSLPDRPPRKLRAEPLASGGADALPAELAPRRLLRRLLQVVALLAVIVLVALLAPGLGAVRDRLAEAAVGWLAVAVALEALSCGSYVLMFRGIFCARMSWRTSAQIAWSELAVGSLVPASGAAGLALGAWILHRGGMDPDRIARRSVAFFLIKSSVNFVAVAVLGALMAVGLVGPDRSLLLTALPAALSVVVIALVLAIPRLGPGRDPDPDASRVRRATVAVRRAVIGGTAEAVEILRARDVMVVAGAIGYWAFDNAVLWATFHAVGADVPLSVVLMGYLIGQLGGLLPLPGGVGGIDGGLIGTLVVYGAPAAATTAAVLAYRVILFWLPLVGGAIAFATLRRALDRAERPDLCEPIRAA